MKPFSTYQCVLGNPMTERDKQEAGSKFWNEGKWDNFVAPFLPEDCSEQVLVDMGCNAGLFLKLAEDTGFSQVVGVDANKEAIKRAIAYREKVGGSYQIQRRRMERSVDKMPVADFTILANAHYYFHINDWLDYLDRLVAKTRYCIIVTAKKREVRCKASANPVVIRRYFRDWDEAGMVEPSMEGDPYPRKLWGLCFKSRLIERVPIDSITNGNHMQDGFLTELDKGIDPMETTYLKDLRRYRRRRKQKKWTEDRFRKYMDIRHKVYESVKKYGLLKPIIINAENRVIDGNHRARIIKHLGYKTILVRRA